LDDETSSWQTWVYTLYGVLVHDGDLHGGHYFTFIKPDRDSRWLKFDDERVTPATEHEVLEDNYGDQSRSSSAYMLVYIRESAIDEVLGPLKDEDTPTYLSAL
jgi:ubiquitin carboxyl-terminal hydrolase 7